MTGSSTAGHRRPTGVEQRPLGWWGMALTVMVVATTYAAMYFAYVYIRVSSLHWPPDGVPPPATGVALLAGAALVAGAVAVRLALRFPLPGLAAALLLAAVHGWLVVDDWAQPGFEPTAHAYGSVSVVLPALHLCLVGIGAVMAAVLLALSLRGVTPQQHVGMHALVLWWAVVAFGGVVLLALVYGIPHVWSQPWPVAP